MSTNRSRQRTTTTLLLGLIVPVVALVAVLVTRPHWDAAASASRGSAGTNAITIQSFSYHPTPLRVQPGAAIAVTNADGTAHTLSAQTRIFDTGNLNAGAHATITAPTQPGRYSYYCKIHNYMTGTLEVTR